MNERWVCKRCFTSNDGDHASCERCELARGSEPPADDGWQATTATEAPAPWWRSLLRFAWIPVVLVVVGAGIFFAARRDDSGQIVGGGDLSVAELRVGDCFDLKDADQSEVADVTAKPCSEPHEYELIFVGEMPEGAYPSDAETDAYVGRECVPAFDDFVGLAYADSRLELFYFSPTEGGWSAGDRGIQCAVYDPADSTLTETLRGAAR
jgi:hypothetical protein